MRLSILILLFSLFCCLSESTFANRPKVSVEELAADKPYTKSISKLYKVASEGRLSLENKHGDITFSTWDKNQVKINVVIEVDASSESSAQVTFDGINFSFSNTQKLVSAKTDINLNRNKPWKKQSHSFKVNYTVFAPKAWQTDFINKYGDIRMPDMQSDIDINISYGDFYIGDVAGNTKVAIAYGSGHFGNLKSLDANFRYSDVKIKSATKALIVSKYSESIIKRLETLDLDSQYDEYSLGSVKTFINAGKYDDFKIDSAWSVQLASRFTEISINYLGEDADMDMSYGHANVLSTDSNMDKLNVKGNFTDFTFRLHPNLTYSLTAAGKFTDINLPSEAKFVRKEESGFNKTYLIRHGADPKANMVFDTNYGQIKVK